MNAIILFIICTAVNVVLSTIKSLATVNGGKFAAAFWNAVTYGFYTYVVILTTIDGISTVEKMLITFACNFVGVYIVKLFEEKARKDKLWKVEMAIPYGTNLMVLKNRIEWCGVPCNYIEVGKWVMFNCYCETQSQTKAMTELAKEFNGKISAYESKTL